MTRRGDDSGFSVVELTIAMAISAVVMVSLMGILVSQSNAERRVSTFADNQELIRQTLVTMQRDIRSSEPLNELSASADYELRIELNVYDAIDAAASTPIRWVVDDAADELRREVLDGSGNVVQTSHRLAGVVNDGTNPLFEFFRANGNAYDIDGDDADLPADVAECTVRVRVMLQAAPNPGPAPARLISDAQLRNRLPGGTGCNTTPVTTP